MQLAPSDDCRVPRGLVQNPAFRHDQLEALRTRRLERWQNQQSEMQVGGTTEAANVLDSFLNDRGWGY